MINITIGGKKIHEHKVNTYLFVVPEDTMLSGCAQEAQEMVPSLGAIFKQREFTGKKGQLLSVPTMVQNEVANCIFVGVGKAKGGNDLLVESYRRAVGKGVKTAIAFKATSLAIIPPAPTLFNIDVDTLVKETIVIANMAAYKFDEFITKDKDTKIDLIAIVLCGDAVGDAIEEQTVTDATVLARAVNKARV